MLLAATEGRVVAIVTAVNAAAAPRRHVGGSGTVHAETPVIAAVVAVQRHRILNADFMITCWIVVAGSPVGWLVCVQAMASVVASSMRTA